MTKPLEGVRVLDLSHVHAGPLCTYHLGLLGAEIIKVESVQGGDQFRMTGGIPAWNEVGLGTGFVGQNAGKKSLAVDLKTDAGQEIVRKLVPGCDVLVENMRPGTLGRLGFAWDIVHDLAPALVYCSISGFGQQGPWKDRAAFDYLMQGVSGMMSHTGEVDGAPVRVGFAAADTSTAMAASFAIVAALLRARMSGEGCHLDVSMLECCMIPQSLQVWGWLMAGQEPVRTGSGALARAGCVGLFETGSGKILVNANNQKLFENYAAAVDRPDLASDERFATDRGRAVNRAELRAELEAALVAHTAVEWEGILSAAGVPCGQLATVPEALANPQFEARGTLGRIKQPDGVDGEIAVQGPGFLIDGAAMLPTAPAPLLGGDTEAILGDLGYTRDDIAALAEQAVIGTG